MSEQDGRRLEFNGGFIQDKKVHVTNHELMVPANWKVLRLTLAQARVYELTTIFEHHEGRVIRHEYIPSITVEKLSALKNKPGYKEAEEAGLPEYLSFLRQNV